MLDWMRIRVGGVCRLAGALALAAPLIAQAACAGQISPPGAGSLGDNPVPLPAASCDAAGGTAQVSAPALAHALGDAFQEAWQGAPAVADLDGDGEVEILAPRHDLLLGWHVDGQVVFRAEVGARIWASPVVADLDPARPGLEVAAAAGSEIYAWSAGGDVLPGFPATWRSEVRSLAAGDVNGDGSLDLVAVTTSRLEQSGQRDVILAVDARGAVLPGFPPNTTGASGCDDHCYPTGGFDQNVALGDVDGDGIQDIFAPHDNAYLSLHDGTGRAFDAAAMFEDRTKIQGVRFLHDLEFARLGYAPDEESANQAHFTNSAPAIADVDGDGVGELVVLGSVQNASQSDRERGVALWVVESDGSRTAGWEQPFHVPAFLSGLEDFEGTAIVAANNHVAVVELDPVRPGPEMVFAGFDGRIRAVDSAATEIWRYTYTTDRRVLTGGAVVADLSRDGVPEIVFATYSTDEGKGRLVVLDAGGSELHSVPLPGRGAMPVPTIADADGDGQLDIVVSLKDASEGAQILVFAVAGSADNCLPWPTGRRDLHRDGFVPPAR